MPNKSEVPVTASNLEAYVKKYGSSSGGGSNIDPDNYWDEKTFEKFYLSSFGVSFDTKILVRALQTNGNFYVAARNNYITAPVFRYDFICGLTDSECEDSSSPHRYAAGFLSTFGNTDTYGDIYFGGLFIKELTKWDSPMRYIHSVSAPCLKQLNDQAFQQNSFIKSVYFPKVSSIGIYTFNSCFNLTTVRLGDPTIVNGHIGNNTFNYCQKLESLYLLGKYSFSANFGTVFYNTPMVSYAFISRWGSVYVPRSLYSYYTTLSQCSTYKHRFVSF